MAVSTSSTIARDERQVFADGVGWAVQLVFVALNRAAANATRPGALKALHEVHEQFTADIEGEFPAALNLYERGKLHPLEKEGV